MKSLSGKLWAIVLFVGLSLFVNAEVRGEDWKYFAEDAEGKFFYDADSVTRPSKDIIRVSIKIPYSEESGIFVASAFGENNETVRYSIGLFEYHCGHERWRMLSATHHSKDGKVIGSETNNSDELNIIKPEHIHGKLYKILCQ